MQRPRHAAAFTYYRRHRVRWPQIATPRRPRLRAQHPGRRIERGHAGQPRLLRRQRRLRHLAGRAAARCWRRRPATSRSTTTCARGWTPATASTAAWSTCRRSAARDGVAELIRVNPELKKIFIVTEKIAVHDAREIRAMAQANGVDIFGGNSLGVADSLEPGAHRRRARRRPARTRRCARARSRSSPTPAASPPRSRSTCAWRAGARRRWSPRARTSTSTTPRREFAFALRQRRAQQGARCCMRAGRLLRARRRLQQAGGGLRGRALEEQADARRRPCRRDGRRRRRRRRTRNAGSWTSSASTRSTRPRTRCVSTKGAVVTNIAHIPAALTAVMAANGAQPDFAPDGSLALKPWFGQRPGPRAAGRTRRCRW